jgi:hypothetical protein
MDQTPPHRNGIGYERSGIEEGTKMDVNALAPFMLAIVGVSFNVVWSRPSAAATGIVNFRSAATHPCRSPLGPT